MDSGKRQKALGSLFVNLALLLLVIVWTVPTLGIFVSSFRHRDDIATSGWWTVLPYRDWRPVREMRVVDLGLDPDGVMEIEGVSGTFEEFRARALDAVPLKRIIQPEEVAELVAFLSSPAAKAITGQTYNICGGQTMD